MGKSINKVKEIELATIEGSKTLAVGVDRRAVERCKEAIEKLGVLHTPVVGATESGKRMLLSGQCELTALRELGAKKIEAIEIGVTGDAGASAKLSLLLMSLKDGPGALCEGLLLLEAVGAGVPRSEIQIMLGKSASWISNRLSLVTRLDGNVYEMVRGGLLDPRSAQEVARLPTQVQFAFAEKAVREGLPKSAIEARVAGYNDESCPDAVRTQIMGSPRAALKRMADKRRAANVCQTGRHKESAPPDVINEHINSARLQMAALCHMFCNELPFEAWRYRDALEKLETELLALLVKIRGLVSPGKMEVGNNAG
jgi:ParB-like chromosome segregation protein Spo0J